MVIRFSTGMSLDDGSDARGARGTLTDGNLRQVHELDDDSCISSEVLEAIAHVDEMVGDLRAEGYSCDSTIEKLVWAASACREAADSMDELRSELRSQQAKRRRVALEDHDAAEDNDGSSDDDASDDDGEPGESAEDDDSAADDESANEGSADLDMWAMHLQTWPLPAAHPEAGHVETLETSVCTYVKWAECIYAVNYAENVLHLLGDAATADDWAEMDGGDAVAFERFFPYNARDYPTTTDRMGHH